MERDQLVAYLATLGCLAIVFIAALIAATMGHLDISKMETFGLGTITGGLIGVLRLPVTHSPAQSIGRAETVVQNTDDGKKDAGDAGKG